MLCKMQHILMVGKHREGKSRDRGDNFWAVLSYKTASCGLSPHNSESYGLTAPLTFLMVISFFFNITYQSDRGPLRSWADRGTGHGHCAPHTSPRWGRGPPDMHLKHAQCCCFLRDRPNNFNEEMTQEHNFITPKPIVHRNVLNECQWNMGKSA